jgi:hypothetical protein
VAAAVAVTALALAGCGTDGESSAEVPPIDSKPNVTVMRMPARVDPVWSCPQRTYGFDARTLEGLTVVAAKLVASDNGCIVHVVENLTTPLPAGSVVVNRRINATLRAGKVTAVAFDVPPQP